MHFLSVSIGAVVLGATTVAAVADKLPKDAVPLSPAEVRAIFSDKTGVYSGISEIYYNPNGSTKGVTKSKNTFKGKWAVKGNEHCMYNKSKGDSKTYTDCKKFWKVGKKIWANWTVHYDGSKPDKTNGYYSGEEKKYRNGDLVSKRYAALGGA